MHEPRSRATEETLFQQRVITLRSVAETSNWFFAMWIGTILAIGTVGAVAFSIPDTIHRVNLAHAEDMK